MGSVEKLTADLQAERQKLALYEKNLRVAVESCKALKAEKENLANIIAGFACAEVKPGSTDINDLKQKIALLTKEFQSKENALVLARTTVLKENQELKKRLAEAESLPNSLTTRNTDNGFQVAELEQKLRKEMSMNRKYEQRLQQLETQLKNSSSNDSKFEAATKKLEAEREQFKKLYEDSHGRSIYLERKFASLQLDQKRDEAETPKVALATGPEDDVRIAKLETQIMNLSKRCDDKEDELSELSAIITSLKEENIMLSESLEQYEKKRSLSPVDEFGFLDGMSEEYDKFRKEKKENANPLEFCCSALRDDIIDLIDKTVEKSGKSDQVKQQQSQIQTLERTIRMLNDKINSNDLFRADVEKKLEKLGNEISQRDSELTYQKEEVHRIKDSLRLEKSKRNELEEEVLRQRHCAQEEIESRDQEIEAFRKMLVTFRHEKMERSQNPRKISRHNRSSTHEDERRRSRTFSQDEPPVPNDPDSKNVYYENQLTKKDYDIQELRKQLMDVEIRLRENESVAMSRQLESVARNEEMTEKVRVLEGKLQMLSSTSEIDYLRNIFTQFLHSMTSPNPASKAILKAMGSVLKVPIAEMKMIDKK